MRLGPWGANRAGGGLALFLYALLCLTWLSPAAARSKRREEKAREPAAAAVPAEAAAPAAAAAGSQPDAAAAKSAAQDPCLSEPRCNELYEKARALSRANQYEAALVMYQQTYAMRPLPWLLLNIGRVQQKLGRHEQAAVSYRKIIEPNRKLPADELEAASDVEVTAKAREYLKQAEDAVAAQKQERPQVAPTAVAPVEKVPLYKKWWFWTALSGGIGLAALGIGLGVGLSSRGSGLHVPSNTEVFYPNL